MQQWFYIRFFFSSAKSSDWLEHEAYRRISKNWLCSAMTISRVNSTTVQQAGVHSHRCLEMDPAKNDLTKKLATHNSPSTVFESFYNSIYLWYSHLQNRLRPLLPKKILSTDHISHFWRWHRLCLSSYILYSTAISSLRSWEVLSARSFNHYLIRMLLSQLRA